jgi:hypothetical protein
VITGRVADAALFLGAAAHAHGWQWDDWDRLAAGTLIGHLLECSGQVAGGNYSGEWWTIPHPWDLPYPIAEVEPDGTAVITKPKESGGRVDFDTVRHSCYEVRDQLPRPTSSPASRRRCSPTSGRPRSVEARRAATPPKALLAYPPVVGEARAALVAGRTRGEAAARSNETGRDGRVRRRMALRSIGACALGGPTAPPPDPPGASGPWRCADNARRHSSPRVIPLTLSARPPASRRAGRR